MSTRSYLLAGTLTSPADTDATLINAKAGCPGGEGKGRVERGRGAKRGEIGREEARGRETGANNTDGAEMRKNVGDVPRDRHGKRRYFLGGSI